MKKCGRIYYEITEEEYNDMKDAIIDIYKYFINNGEESLYHYAMDSSKELYKLIEDK